MSSDVITPPPAVVSKPELPTVTDPVECKMTIMWSYTQAIKKKTVFDMETYPPPQSRSINSCEFSLPDENGLVLYQQSRCDTSCTKIIPLGAQPEMHLSMGAIISDISKVNSHHNMQHYCKILIRFISSTACAPRISLLTKHVGHGLFTGITWKCILLPLLHYNLLLSGDSVHWKKALEVYHMHVWPL